MVIKFYLNYNSNQYVVYLRFNELQLYFEVILIMEFNF